MSILQAKTTSQYNFQRFRTYPFSPKEIAKAESALMLEIVQEGDLEDLLLDQLPLYLLYRVPVVLDSP